MLPIGLDSIKAVLLLNKIEREYGKRLNPSSITGNDYASPVSLSKVITAVDSKDQSSIKEHMDSEIEALSDWNFTGDNKTAYEMKTFFVTGATGFTGTFLLRQLLFKYPQCHIICHARASSDEEARRRIIITATNALYWDESMASHFTVWHGDLESEYLGLDADKWGTLCKLVDVIIHNGAMVHWIKSYGSLKPANVLSTKYLIESSASERPKSLVFVSGGNQNFIDTGEEKDFAYVIHLCFYRRAEALYNAEVEPDGLKCL